MSKSNRTKKQFNAFRHSFKKWRARWLKDARAYAWNEKTQGVSIYSEDLTLLSEYIAPGYLTYMRYQLRKLKKVK